MKKLTPNLLIVAAWGQIGCAQPALAVEVENNGVGHLLEQRSAGLLLPDWVIHGLEFMAVLIVVVVGIFILTMTVLFIIDVTQQRNTIWHNYRTARHFIGLRQRRAPAANRK